MEAMWHLEVTEDTQIIAKSIANYTLKYEDNWTTGPNRSSLLFESDHVSPALKKSSYFIYKFCFLLFRIYQEFMSIDGPIFTHLPKETSG